MESHLDSMWGGAEDRLPHSKGQHVDDAKRRLSPGNLLLRLHRFIRRVADAVPRPAGHESELMLPLHKDDASALRNQQVVLSDERRGFWAEFLLN